MASAPSGVKAGTDWARVRSRAGSSMARRISCALSSPSPKAVASDRVGDRDSMATAPSVARTCATYSDAKPLIPRAATRSPMGVSRASPAPVPASTTAVRTALSRISMAALTFTQRDRKASHKGSRPMASSVAAVPSNRACFNNRVSAVTRARVCGSTVGEHRQTSRSRSSAGSQALGFSPSSRRANAGATRNRTAASPSAIAWLNSWAAVPGSPCSARNRPMPASPGAKLGAAFRHAL